MKKLISFIILLALCISLFGCAKAPIDSASPYALIENKRPTDDAVQTPDDALEQTPQQITVDTNSDSETNALASTNPNVEKPSVDIEQNDTETEDETDTETEDETEPEPYEPLKFDVNDEFNPYDVVVTFTVDESYKRKTYTVEDFPELDIYHVFEYEEYYSEVCYPQINALRSFVLILNKPSKQRVLKYCEILEKDPRVQFARPNINSYSKDYKATYQVKLKSDVKSISVKDFPELDLLSIFSPGGSGFDSNGNSGLRLNSEKIIRISFDPKEARPDFSHHKKFIKMILKSELVEQVEPLYDYIVDNTVYVHLSKERYSQSKELTIDEFPPIYLSSDLPPVEVTKIIDFEHSSKTVRIFFQNCDKKGYYKVIKTLLKNKNIAEVEPIISVPVYPFKLQDMDGIEFAK